MLQALFLFINVMRLLVVKEGPHCAVAVIISVAVRLRDRLLANARFFFSLSFLKKEKSHYII